MPRGEPSGSCAPPGGLAGLGLAAFAVTCCAALPLLLALAGGVAIGTVLGVGAGLVAAALLGGLLVTGRRRRGAREPRGQGNRSRGSR